MRVVFYLLAACARGLSIAVLMGFCMAVANAQSIAPAPDASSASQTIVTNAVAAVPQVAPPMRASFSPFALYQQADGVGKGVFLLLILASLTSWSLWAAKLWELMLRRYRLKHSIDLLANADSTHDQQLPAHSSHACVDMLALVQAELATGSGDGGSSPAAHIKERAHARILRVEAAEARILTRGASILATTSSIAPFIGLFGTVWGIMHSFISISQSRSTNLSVVAPGIAEALFATALGLAVAVPAVIFYNIIARQISGYRLQLSDAATLILCLLSRDLDRREDAAPGKADPAAKA